MEQLNALVLTIACSIGRRMAREDFEKVMRTTNDNNATGERMTGFRTRSLVEHVTA